MKYLFFVLVVVNVAFYLWEIGAGREKSGFDRIDISLPDETERIVLIKELKVVPRRSPVPKGKGESIQEQALPTAAPESEAKPEPVVAPAPKPADPYCFLIGPFRKEAQARAAQEAIGERMPGAEVVPGLAETTDGYWVLYPKAESVDAAKINRTMLISKGIHDLWVFDKGELTGAISLGLYKTRDRAEIAQKHFFEQNLKVEVVPRVSRSPAQWVRLHWEGGRDELEDMAVRLASRQGAQPAQVKGCD